MPVVNLLHEVFFRQSMPGLTTNTAKEEALRDFNPTSTRLPRSEPYSINLIFRPILAAL